MVIPLWVFDPIFWIRVLAPIAAAYLLVRGWRGRIEGSDPYCRRCGYNLTGLASGRCPECGTPLDRRAVRHGRRKRSGLALAMAGVFFVVSFVAAGEFVRRKVSQINWQNYRGLESVLAEAESGDINALNELKRRLYWRTLTPDELDRLYAVSTEIMARTPRSTQERQWLGVLRSVVMLRPESADEYAATTELALGRIARFGSSFYQSDFCDFLIARLDEGKLSGAQLDAMADALFGQNPSRAAGDTSPMLRGQHVAYGYVEPKALALLSKLAATGALNEAQMEAFFAQFAARPLLQVRGRVTPGECLPVRLFLTAAPQMLPQSCCELIALEFSIGEQPLSAPPVVNSDRRPYGGLDDCLPLPALPPGQYEVRCRVAYTCRQTRSSLPDYQSTVEFEARALTEVLPEGEPDITVLNDPGLAAAFREAFLVRREPERDQRRAVSIICEWNLTLPASTAFDAIARVGDHEEKCGIVTCLKGQVGMQQVPIPRSLLDASREFTLILRANPTFGRNVAHLLMTWTGEIEFGPFRLEKAEK